MIRLDITHEERWHPIALIKRWRLNDMLPDVDTLARSLASSTTLSQQWQEVPLTP